MQVLQVNATDLAFPLGENHREEEGSALREHHREEESARVKGPHNIPVCEVRVSIDKVCKLVK